MKTQFLSIIFCFIICFSANNIFAQSDSLNAESQNKHHTTQTLDKDLLK